MGLFSRNFDFTTASPLDAIMQNEWIKLLHHAASRYSYWSKITKTQIGEGRQNPTFFNKCLYWHGILQFLKAVGEIKRFHVHPLGLPGGDVTVYFPETKSQERLSYTDVPTDLWMHEFKSLAVTVNHACHNWEKRMPAELLKPSLSFGCHVMGKQMFPVTFHYDVLELSVESPFKQHQHVLHGFVHNSGSEKLLGAVYFVRAIDGRTPRKVGEGICEIRTLDENDSVPFAVKLFTKEKRPPITNFIFYPIVEYPSYLPFVKKTTNANFEQMWRCAIADVNALGSMKRALLRAPTSNSVVSDATAVYKLERYSKQIADMLRDFAHRHFCLNQYALKPVLEEVAQ